MAIISESAHQAAQYLGTDVDTAVCTPPAWERQAYRQPRARKIPCDNALSDGERVRLEKSRAAVNKDRRQIERLRADGKTREANRRIRTLHKSKALRIVSAAKARKTTKFANGKPSLTELEEQISAGVTEPARITAVAKPNGGFRKITAYGAPDKARQIIAARSYGAAVRFHEHQFGVPGRGMRSAIQRVSELIKSRRYSHAIELDIKDCFGNVRPQAITERWNVPEDVIDEIITLKGKESRGEIEYGNKYSRIYRNEPHTRCALPQGSASSPIFAYGVLAPVIVEFERLHGAEVAVTNYCDNFIVLGQSRAAVQDAVTTLVRLLFEHPAGPFALVQKTGIRHLSRGFCSLGYKFAAQPGKPIVRADADKVQEFKAGLADKIREIHQPSGKIISSTSLKISHAAKFALRYLSGFRQAPEDHFKLCWKIATAFKPYQGNPDVRRLMRHIERKAPSDAEREQNRLLAEACPPSRRPAPNYRITNCLLPIPKGFRVSDVIAKMREER